MTGPHLTTDSNIERQTPGTTRGPRPKHNRRQHQSPVVRRALGHSSSKEEEGKVLLNNKLPAFPRATNLEASNGRRPRKGAGMVRKHTASGTGRLRTMYHFMVDSDY